MTYRHYLVNEGPISTLAQKYAGPKGPTQTTKRENEKTQRKKQNINKLKQKYDNEDNKLYLHDDSRYKECRKVIDDNRKASENEWLVRF